MPDKIVRSPGGQNLDHLLKTAIADTTDPVDIAEVVDNTIMADVLTDDGDTSGYDRRTDSLEALSDAIVEDIGIITHVVSRTEAALALKNTNVDFIGVDSIGGAITDMRLSLKMDNDAAATTYTLLFKKTSHNAPTTFVDQTIPAVATITPATALGWRHYDVGDLDEGLEWKLNLAQTNDGDATRIVEVVLAYDQ